MSVVGSGAGAVALSGDRSRSHFSPGFPCGPLHCGDHGRVLRFQPPPHRTVHAVLPHTAHRRRSPPASGFSRQGFPALYYSCCFSIRDRTAAQRGLWFRCDAYLVSPPSGRRRSGHGGCQACGVVVPAGAGLMTSAPCGPAQVEGEAGPADEAGFPVASQPVDAGGLGGRQLDRGDAGRAGLAAEVRQRRGPGPELQVSAIGGWLVGDRLAGGRPGGGRGRQDCGSGERGLDRGGAQLGEGGQRGVPIDRVPVPGLALVPAEGILPCFESYFTCGLRW